MPARFPSRFRDPSRRAPLSLLERFYYRGDPHPTPEQGLELGRLLSQGDPLADALVQHWLAQPGGFGAGRKQLDVALEHGVAGLQDPPAPLVALFEQLEQKPRWLDDERVELGRRSGARVGIAGSYVLGCMALMGGYRFSATTKPLVFTGALERNAARRLDETAKYVCDVYSPGGLDRRGAGFASTVRVRVMHALVRHAASRSATWQQDDWGLPINQTDMLGTNLLFSVVYLTGLRAMGMRFTREEADALIHMWRYIGYLMGVQERLLPATEIEGRRLAYAMFRSQPGADDDSRRLAKALADAPYTRARGELRRKLVDLDVHYRLGLSRALLGNKIADELGLPDDRWKYAIALTTPPTFAFETVRRIVPGLTDVAVRMGERSLRRLAARITQHEAVSFIPDGRHGPQPRHVPGATARLARA
jgi:hypothetical protein